MKYQEINEKSWIFDIETNKLLNNETVDYTVSPFKAKDNFKLHIVAFRNIITNKIEYFDKRSGFEEMPYWIRDNVDYIAGHNIIAFDLLALKLMFGNDFNYKIGFGLDPNSKDMWCGKEITIVDTLVLAKTLNPDLPKYSLDYFGKMLKLGNEKTDFRKASIETGLIKHSDPKGAEFNVYSDLMRDYCIQDTSVNKDVLLYLVSKIKGNNIELAGWMEHYYKNLVTKQEHRGFYFDTELAKDNVNYLDKKLKDIEVSVEPYLPLKDMPKTEIALYTPPKIKFKKDGTISKVFENFLEKHNAELVKDSSDDYLIKYNDKQYKMDEPLKSKIRCKIRDAALKEHLISLGWNPVNWGEKDITIKTASKGEAKRKKTYAEYVKGVERYLKDKKDSQFLPFALKKLGVGSFEEMRDKLLTYDISKTLKVYTSPKYTKDQEKNIDDGLYLLEDKFPCIRDVVEYMTYQHRRNSILGDGYNYEDDSDDEPEKGYMAYIRDDNRVPTPCDPCGAATTRTKHRVINL